MNAKNVSYIGVFTSIALILSYFERIIPSIIPIPGVKLGIANIIILICLYLLSNKDAFIVMLLKVILVSLLFTGITGFIYGAFGSLFSYISMLIFKKTNLFSIIGISIIGAVMFNVGQILASMIFIRNIYIFYYLPILIFFGLISGFLTGIISHYIINRLKMANLF